MGSRAKPQPTKDLVHIQGQNNSSRCTIFVAFAEEKILHFAQKNKLGTTIPATSALLLRSLFCDAYGLTDVELSADGMLIAL